MTRPYAVPAIRFELNEVRSWKDAASGITTGARGLLLLRSRRRWLAAAVAHGLAGAEGTVPLQLADQRADHDHS